MQGEILRFLKEHDVKYKENIKLSSISPIRIGGVANIVAYPNVESKLCKLVEFLHKHGIKHKIVGRMTNLLPPDEDFDGVVVRCDLLNRCELSNNLLTTFSGASLTRCANLLCKKGLSGFEGLSGIPGSIGGALVGNAGAFGTEIADALLAVRVFDPKSGSIKNLSKYDCGFAYRYSRLKSAGLIILLAQFLLKESDESSVRAEMGRYKALRIKTQPFEPSLGSTFKRPGNTIFASRLIDECGLKGHRVGGAEISKKHAGFIVNIGGATAKDYVDLSNYAAKCVFEKFKISLEREIEIMR